ncbi:hypothetical protein HanXRQr2_Chr17g0805751 [Helianthus annuus]|uniref:Uncharacterized protein n=1 Tax=Helianthus annuus TaxID=4232 RepID=A0A9K3DK92_HELAN|nr:hypothetical protein HanXRQr2_Chr17g0805751 [Helianthus annuus]
MGSSLNHSSTPFGPSETLCAHGIAMTIAHNIKTTLSIFISRFKLAKLCKSKKV